MTTPNKKEFLRMVNAYLAGTATPKQSAAVEQYFDLFSAEPDYLEDLERKEIRVIHDRLKSKIDASIESQAKPGFIHSWKIFSVAATLIFSCAAGYYFYQNGRKELKPFSTESIRSADVLPGSNKAVLTLDDGREISLTDAKAGRIAAESGILIQKTRDGKVIYAGHTNAEKAFNKIETPKGGQYQVTLSDGTQVWLNAASSLRYPVNFSGNERKVELTGEGYFEVTSNKHKPFRVVTNRQVVEVLGTHFNINAYQDETAVRTSLLEGSVQVTNSITRLTSVIIPGQQSVITSGSEQIKIKNIDVDEAIAWKNGYFMFDDEPLSSILRKIARWYDVEIVYQGLAENNQISFSGTLSRYSNVSKALNKLELTGAVHFKISGKEIIVTP